LETGKCEHILNGHRYGVWSLQFDDSLMVSGAEGTTTITTTTTNK
jgi:hypothetical protein